jgi:hypothetical protein
MTPFLRPVGATLFGCLIAAGAAAQEPQTNQAAAASPQVAIIGCVDRAVPTLPDDPTRTTPPPGGQRPAAAYKLIDTQPGGGSPVVDATGRVLSTPPAKGPEVVEPQYWLAGPPTIDFAKYQNQRVEIIGSLKPSDRATTAQATTPPDAPKTVLTATSLRVVSTECK